MRVGDRLAELLLENGVEYVFGVPGGQTLPLYEGISKYQGRIEHVLMRDERSAGYAADAHARISGKVGVCDGTVGPGATNLISPLAEAHCSSIPLIAIVSDVARAWEYRRTRGNASQAMDQMDMFKPVSKWQVRVTDPRSIDAIMNQAFRVATTGKPGPVVVCVPDDVGSAEVDFTSPVEQRGGAVYPHTRSAPDPEQVEAAVDAFCKATYPLLVVGGGGHISGCYDEVRELLDKSGAMLATSISGKAIVEEYHPQVVGVTGTFGNPAARDVMQQADLIFFIGCKAGQLTTFSYRCPDQATQVIHLDNDPEEIGRNFANTIPLVADARLGLQAFLSALGDRKSSSAWQYDDINAAHADWFTSSTEPGDPSEPLKPQAMMRLINDVITDDDLVVCDASLASGWAAAYLQFQTAGRRMIAPRGLAGLGWGSPATIGAALATLGKRRIIQFAGDGGFGYSLQELEVMARYKLPVISIIFNNDTLGWIKHVQKDYYQENYISTDFSHIDFATVARGFGAAGYNVNTLEELSACLTEVQHIEGPVVIDAISSQWETPVLGLRARAY